MRVLAFARRGWSSVGPGGKNVGRWMMTTMEFSNSGQMKVTYGDFMKTAVDKFGATKAAH